MKGFIIYEDYRGKKVVEAVKLGVVNYTTSSSDGDWVSELSGIRKSSTQAYCNKEDTYDFEVGALIALMKMCGRDKVTKACDELYKDDNYKNALQEVTESLDSLSKKYDLVVEGYDYWKEQCKKLDKENKELHKNIDKLFEDNKYWKSEGGRLSFEKHRLEEKVEKLQHEYDLCKNSESALKCSVDYLNKSIAKLNTAIYGYKEDLYKVAERCKELEEENEMLCDKIKFLDKENRNLVYGGRQNGKQYTALVELFKKIGQKKVDAAYKEAYNTTLPVWQKEVLKQMYDVYEESKEKTVQIKGFNINIKPSTKREQMWNDILACGDCEHSKYVKVKKEDLETFAKECNEKKIFNIIGYEFCPQGDWFYGDSCIFQIFRKPAGFICTKRVGFVFKDTVIDYLPPMRWDLFRKGRLVVKVNYDNYKEFYEACEKEIGRKPRDIYTGTFTVYYKYEKELKKYIFHTRPYIDTIPFAKKIVNWEDVR